MTAALPFPETPPARLARLLAAVLACANSSPPTCHCEAFYAMKDAILRKHGKLVGADLQHIVKKCWGGYDYPCRGASCRKCGGTGIYSERWHILQRWELGGRIFHRPIDSTSLRPDGPVTIEGNVEHRRWMGHQPLEAAMWLALVFDRRLFCRMAFLPASCACGWFWLPLVNLARISFRLRMFVWRFQGRKCYCGRTYRQWFGSGGWCVCWRCRRRHNRVPALAEDPSIPF